MTPYRSMKEEDDLVLHRVLPSVVTAAFLCGCCCCVTAETAFARQSSRGPLPPPTAPPQPTPLVPAEITGAKTVVTALIQANRKRDGDAWVECLTNDTAGTMSIVPLSIIALALDNPRRDKVERAADARADFEKMLQRYKIEDFIHEKRITDNVDKELTRRGRGILKSVYSFMERLSKEGLLQSKGKSSFTGGLPKNADGFLYQVQDSRRVLVFDGRSGQKAMEARLEMGKWRLQISRDAKWDKGPTTIKPMPRGIFM